MNQLTRLKQAVRGVDVNLTRGKVGKRIMAGALVR